MLIINEVDYEQVYTYAHNTCIGYKNIPVNIGGAPKVPDRGT